jgi:hypothetical protein
MHNRFERSAIGAQWELVHRIPAETRARFVRQIDNLDYAKPIPEVRLAAYRRVIASGVLDVFKKNLDTLEANGVLAKREFDAAHLIVGSPGMPGSPLARYRRPLLELTSSGPGVDAALSVRARELIGQEGLDQIRRLVLDATTVPDGLASNVWGEADQRALDSLCLFHRRAHQTPRDERLNVIARESFESADLDKATFIAHMEVIHGYDLKRLFHFEMLRPWAGTWRKLLIGQAAVAFFTGGSIFWAKDVQWIYDHIVHLLHAAT